MSKPNENRPARIVLAAAVTAATVLAAALAGFAGPIGPSAAVAQYEPPPKKVTICHHANGQNGTKHVTITVAQSAVASHVRHGDTLGACTTTASVAKHGKPAHVKAFHKHPRNAKARGNRKK